MNGTIMSLNRFIYYCAVMGGWAALAAWLLAELFFFRGRVETALPAWQRDTLTAAMVGGGIGAALSVLSGIANPRWTVRLRHAVPGLLGGLLGGAIGGFLGWILYSLPFVPRAIGWLIMGMGIGATEGLYERSPRKTRNGLIGGSIGGLLGGLLFDPIARSGAEMSGRALALVIVGISIGLLIGLAHVVLKEAWLTVLDGYRPGRQVILSRDVTTLGRAEHLPLPFLGYADGELEAEHLHVVRHPDGRYLLEPSSSRAAAFLNSQPIDGPVALVDGDVIKLGTNIVRFNHRRRHLSPQSTAGPETQVKRPLAAPPPPPTGFPENRVALVTSTIASTTTEEPPPFPKPLTPGVGPLRPPPPPPG